MSLLVEGSQGTCHHTPNLYDIEKKKKARHHLCAVKHQNSSKFILPNGWLVENVLGRLLEEEAILVYGERGQISPCLAITYVNGTN